MDINAQIKILEALLKNVNNRECADCSSKTPRWASITFGTFVCLRCSGQHRQLQVHITKIKSVNLDKWAPEMVEMYKHVNNAIINTYWEARLPKGYNKPGQNATSNEVESFIRDKYLNKRWVDVDMSADPANMYWNNRKRFDKFIKKVTSQGDADGDEQSDDSSHKKKKKSKKDKKHKKNKDADSDEEEEEVMPSIKTQAPKIIPKQVAPAAPITDLINLDSMPASKPSGSVIDGFSEFQDADPMKSTDDFSDFQQAPKTPSTGGINMQGLMNLYSQNPQYNAPSSAQAPVNKYQALDAFNN